MYKGSIFVAIVVNILSIALILVFMMLPSSYFFEYRQVIIDNPSIPTFISETYIKKPVTIRYSDKMYCESGYIPLPVDKLDRAPSEGFVFGPPWTASFNHNGFVGDKCRLRWEARAMLFGVIPGRPSTGFTEYFILGE